MLIWPKKAENYKTKKFVITYKNFFKKISFGDTKIENKSYCNKTLTFLKDVDTDKVLVSNKIYFGEKKL